MRTHVWRYVMLSSLAAFGVAATAAPAAAAYKGLWLSTPYPEQGLASNKPISLDVTVHNDGMPPEAVMLSVADAPKGWSTQFVGNGKPIGSVFVGPDASKRVDFKLVPPSGGVAPGSYHFVLAGVSGDQRTTLPIDLDFGKSALPARLTLTPDLPDLSGTPHSKFDFAVKLANDSGSDTTARLQASAPPGFEVTFKKKFGSQELTSLPIKAGATEDLKVSVAPPSRVDAGSYKVAILADAGDTKAQTDLTLDVAGTPKLNLSGPDGRISTDASAGSESPLKLTVSNTGSAAAHNIKLTSSPPTGWKVAFAPQAIDNLAAGTSRTVEALITPSSKAIAGDYMVSMSANGDVASKSEEFRIGVQTSTMWGVVGVLIIAAALGVLSLAVIRYGRR